VSDAEAGELVSDGAVDDESREEVDEASGSEAGA
jgi:hypothetical protein